MNVLIKANHIFLL